MQYKYHNGPYCLRLCVSLGVCMGWVCMKLVYCSHIFQEYCLLMNRTEHNSASSLTYCCTLNEIAQCTRVHIQYRDLSLCTITMDDCVCVCVCVLYTSCVNRVFIDYSFITC